jgi:hypothetical protein
LLFKKSQASAGTINNVAITALGSAGVATAVQDKYDNLKVIVWGIDPDNDQVTRRASASAGAIHDVAIASLTPSRLVTAVSDNSHNLKLIVWDFLNGNISRKGDISAGLIGQVAIISLTSSRVATAIRDSSGKLKVIIWDISRVGLLQRKGDAIGEAISPNNKVTITNLGSGRIVTGVVNNAGNLSVAVWDIDANGMVLQKGIGSAGSVSDVAITNLGKAAVATSVRDGIGNLKVIRWDVTATGGVVKKGSASAGPVALVATPNAASLGVFTAVQQSSGALKLIAWEVNDNGFSKFTDASDGGLISKIAITGWIESNSQATLVTAVRDGSHNLKVVVWGFQLSPSLSSQLKNSSTATQNILLTDVSLEQNVPNPFNHATTIKYTLPKQFTNAQILIADQNGNVLKRTNVSGTGKAILNIDAGAFSSGTYTYSLVVDGHLIESKKMVLTK